MTRRRRPGERHGVERPAAAAGGRREPDLAAVRRPGETAHGDPTRREGRACGPRGPRRRRHPPSSPRIGMLEEGDEVAARRDARVAQVPRRVPRRASGRSETRSGSAPRPSAARRGSRRRPPSRPPARTPAPRAARRRRASSARACRSSTKDPPGARRARRHLARRRDREHVRRRERQRRGFGGLGPRRVDPDRPAVPGGAVDDRLPVGRQARRPDRAVAEGQPPEGRLVAVARAAEPKR